MSAPPRKRVQAVARGAPSSAGAASPDVVAFPLAFEVAAEVSARPLDAFLEDPTQLANGLGELARAIASDGIVCTRGLELDRGSLEAARALAAPRVVASLEATRRLRATFGDAIALVAVLEGPAALANESGDPGGEGIEAAGELLAAAVRDFAQAGADVFLIEDPAAPPDGPLWREALTTVSRIAKFHRGVALLLEGGASRQQGAEAAPLPSPERSPLESPAPAKGGAIVTTSSRVERLDLPAMTAWCRAVRPAPTS